VTKLLLASASPRRADILRAAGIAFEIVPSAFEEPPAAASDHARPAEFVMRLAREKAAHAIWDEPAHGPAPFVLSADTIVWHDGHILGKPRDEAQARAMLLRLRGRSHQVFTGICLRHGQDFHVAHETTTVHFSPVSDEWIEAYAHSGEPLDKAGAYAAQGRGAFLVSGISGDFWNVVGLPVATLGRLLETVGAPPEQWWRSGELGP
jgi:septum formation protein